MQTRAPGALLTMYIQRQLTSHWKLSMLHMWQTIFESQVLCLAQAGAHSSRVQSSRYQRYVGLELPAENKAKGLWILAMNFGMLLVKGCFSMNAGG